MRRWRLSVPALILAIAAAVGAFLIIPPSYLSTRQMLILPSAVTAGVDEATNPFLNFGSTLVSTAGVLQLKLMTPQVVSALAKQGASAPYEVTLDGSSPAPIVIITATDHDPAKTTRTVTAVAAQLRASLSSEQQAAGAPRKTWITAGDVFISPKPDVVRKTQIRVSILALVGSLGIFLFALFLLEGRAERKRRYQNAERDWPSDQPERPGLRTPAAGSAYSPVPPAYQAEPLGGVFPPIRPIPESAGPRRPAQVGNGYSRAQADGTRPQAQQPASWSPPPAAAPAGAAHASSGYTGHRPGYPEPRPAGRPQQAGPDDDRPVRPADPGTQPIVQPSLRLKSPPGGPDTHPNGQPVARPNGHPPHSSGQHPGR